MPCEVKACEGSGTVCRSTLELHDESKGVDEKKFAPCCRPAVPGPNWATLVFLGWPIVIACKVRNGDLQMFCPVAALDCLQSLPCSLLATEHTVAWLGRPVAGIMTGACALSSVISALQTSVNRCVLLQWLRDCRLLRSLLLQTTVSCLDCLGIVTL